jgi:Na+-driven multidrug efflux pump
MRDLTQGPIPGNLVQMAVPIAAGMLAQTLYFLVALYFVAQAVGRKDPDDANLLFNQSLVLAAICVAATPGPRSRAVPRAS